MRELARLCAEAGREPARVTVVLGEPDEAVMERCAKAGVYRCAIALVPRQTADVDSLLDRCARLVRSSGPDGTRRAQSAAGKPDSTPVGPFAS